MEKKPAFFECSFCFFAFKKKKVDRITISTYW